MTRRKAIIKLEAREGGSRDLILREVSRNGEKGVPKGRKSSKKGGPKQGGRLKGSRKLLGEQGNGSSKIRGGQPSGLNRKREMRISLQYSPISRERPKWVRRGS